MCVCVWCFICSIIYVVLLRKKNIKPKNMCFFVKEKEYKTKKNVFSLHTTKVFSQKNYFRFNNKFIKSCKFG